MATENSALEVRITAAVERDYQRRGSRRTVSHQEASFWGGLDAIADAIAALALLSPTGERDNVIDGKLSELTVASNPTIGGKSADPVAVSKVCGLVTLYVRKRVAQHMRLGPKASASFLAKAIDRAREPT